MRSRNIINKAGGKIFLLIMAFCILASQPLTTTAQVKASSEYVLGPEDVIEITVSNHSDLNQVVTIRPDGKITFSRAGEVQASGKTARALSTVVQAKLSKYLNNARVAVSVKEAHSRRVRLLGAIKTAGAYQLKPNWRFMDVVALAGGLSTRPTRITGRVIRAGKLIPLNVEQAVLHPESDANLLMEPDDLIVLDEQNISKQINVIGQIKTPGAYDLEENLTVISLITQAGGPTEQAALRNVHVLRSGKRIPLDLYSALAEGKTNRAITKFKFLPSDVLVVPENELRYGVMGEVSKPAYYLLPENTNEATVLKALALAGGPSADGDLREAAITRVVDGKATVVPVDLKSMMEGDAPDNVLLQAGDILVIPKRNNRVHVIGQVAKPGAYELSEGLSLMSLLSEAGSPMNGAGLSKSYVLRGETQIPVNLHSVLINGKADESIANFKLQNGDVLVIPDVTNQVHVIGQVAKPGAYNLDDNLSVVSLIAAVGSPTPRASLKNTYVLRQGAQVPLNLYTLLIENKATPEVANFKFLPGDVLVVPESDALFGVMGQVSNPGYFPVPEKAGEATVLKALALAGGGGADGNLRGAGIIRVVKGTATLIPVNIEEIFRKGKLANNIDMKAGDILYIPPTKQKGFSWKNILSAVPFIGGVF